MNVCRFWDLAATADAGCFSCGVKMVRQGDYFYIADVVRGRWSPHERDSVILQTAQLDGIDIPVLIEQEPGSAGVSVIDSLVRLLVGYTVKGERPTGQKSVRAMPFAAMAEAGYVVLVRGRWNTDFLNELTEFPSGKYKDQVDAAASAFAYLASAPQLPFSWLTTPAEQPASNGHTEKFSPVWPTFEEDRWSGIL